MARTPRRKPSKAWKALPLVVPIAAVAWYLTLGTDARADLLERVPDGAGGRARNAGLAFAALIALAWVAFPIAYHGWRSCGRTVRWCASKEGAVRALLWPFRALASLATALCGVLFVANAVAVLATALITLLTTAWIVRPELFGGQEALLERFGFTSR